MSHGITELSIECTPDKVPPQIEVDITVLEEVEQSIHVKDIIIDPEITIHDDPEQLIAKISEVMVVEEEPEVAEEEAVEGEEGAEEAGEPKAEETAAEAGAKA